MKSLMKLVALSVAIVIFVGAFPGYIPNAVAAGNSTSGIQTAASPDNGPLKAAPDISKVKMPAAAGTNVNRNQKAEIDYSNTADGYVMIKYLRETTKQLRVRITGPSEVTYQYTLKSDGNHEVYPLTDGSGSYAVCIYEQIEGTRYSTTTSIKISVKLTDEFAPYMRPNQYVNFKSDSAVVQKAGELVSGVDGLVDQVSAIYNFIIKNFSYDRQLAATVQSGYLPDVDKVLEKKKGICFDYAAVTTSMLRSQGIPTKLVVGYAGEAYHAWISVYSAETGWINDVIFFDGKEWKLMDPTFASTSNQSAAFLKLIGDGTSYKVRYLY